MARNVMGAGMAVRAWNRTRERAEVLAGKGAHVAATPAEAAAGADVVLTMLADGDAVIAAMDGGDGALGAMREGAVWLQASTIGEEATARCIALAEGAGVPFVDAPVLGTKAPAEQGALIVLASGADDLRERVRPVLDAVGQRTMWVGEAGAGTRLKLVTNAWILAVVEGAAEAVALAEGLGLDPALLLEAVEGGPLDLPYLRMKAAAMAERDFSPSFRLALAAKDAALVEDAARARGMDLPHATAVARRLAEAVDAHGDEDVAATYLTSAPRRPAVS
ncbi:MAG TPA: NAD(P)-dependent oxidoreductase [Miltoncostaea sp.]|nr:NAD(P)-dependent oxidoreductase [Miltoncostaea sp.]